MPEPDPRDAPRRASVPSEWLDKLEIREMIERSMRCIDDQAGEQLAALFDEDAVLQLAGTVFSGREAIRTMFRRPDPRTGPSLDNS
jgi:hypothetical protein